MNIVNRRPCLETLDKFRLRFGRETLFTINCKHGQGNAKRVTSGIEIGNFNEHVNLILQIFNNENPTEVLKLNLNNTQTSYFHFEM